MPTRPAVAMRRESQRHLLLPALQAVQSGIGWISEGALNYVCERLTVPPADAYGVATFYALLSTTPRPRRVLHVCDDIACRVQGRRQGLRSARAHRGPRASPRSRRRSRGAGRGRRDLAAQSLSRPLRPGPGRAAHRRGQRAGRAAVRRRGRRQGGTDPGRRSGPESGAPPSAAPGGRSIASPAPTGGRRRPDQPRRLPRQRRLPGAPARRSRSDPRASSAR